MKAYICCAVSVVLFVLGLQFFIEYSDWLDWNKRDLFKVAPGPCTVVDKGGVSEDLLHLGNNKILISQGINFNLGIGHLLLLDLDTNKVERVKIKNAPDTPDFMMAAHGMSTWRDPETDQLFVYVLTHPESEDRVEVLQVSDNLDFTYVKSISDPSFTYMNDLVVVGKDQFYITSIWKWREIKWITAETWLRIRNGRVVFYDGSKGKEVATGYHMANGINVSPDGSILYMAECGNKKVHAYRRDKSNDLHHMWEYDSGTIVDNIDVDPDTGDLWIGTHPVLWIALDYLKWFGGVPLRSQVIRIKLKDNNVSTVEEIYSDNGGEIAGSTVAVYVNNKLVIGSVGTTTVVCDVNYLSP